MRALALTTSVATALLACPAFALVCASPIHPPCCTVPCPVTDSALSGSLQKIDDTLKQTSQAVARTNHDWGNILTAIGTATPAAKSDCKVSFRSLHWMRQIDLPLSL